MQTLDLFVTGYARPDLMREQHRLLTRYLAEPFTYTLLDNTPDERDAEAMSVTASDLGVSYMPVLSDKHEHADALALAARLAEEGESAYWGCLDHDVFPRAHVTLIDKIRPSGFYGIGQRHAPTQTRYLFPGFVFFSREWLAGRKPNFHGIRGVDKRDDGDTGSMLHVLFDAEDWERMYRGEHGYGFIRDEDTYGLQSFGFEVFDGSWLHLTNASRWLEIPDPDERDRLFAEMLASL